MTTSPTPTSDTTATFTSIELDRLVARYDATAYTLFAGTELPHGFMPRTATIIGVLCDTGVSHLLLPSSVRYVGGDAHWLAVVASRPKSGVAYLVTSWGKDARGPNKDHALITPRQGRYPIWLNAETHQPWTEADSRFSLWGYVRTRRFRRWAIRTLPLTVAATAVLTLLAALLIGRA